MLVFPGRLMTSALGENLFADASAYWPFSTSLSLVGSPGPTLTFTRASASVDFNPNDLSGSPIKDFATNVPILLPALGLGIWESRTNPVLWGRDLSNAAWIKTNMSAVKNAVGANGDANGATTVTATAASATILQTVTATSAARAGQAFVKRSVGTGLVEMTLNGGTNWVDITASLSTTIWFNPKILLTLANPQIGFRITTSGDAIIVDYVDAQAGAFATPPIPTTTAEVVRAADVDSGAVASGAANTVYVSGRTGYGDGVIAQWDSGAETARVRIARVSGNIRVIVTNTTEQANLDMGIVADHTSFKVAVRVAANDIAASLNGGAIVSDPSATVPAMTTIRYGMDTANDEWNDTISAGALWNDQGKPNEFLQEVTT